MSEVKPAIDNLVRATAEAYERICGIELDQKMYQGKIDVSELIDFQELAGRFDLTNLEYEILVDNSQTFAEKALEAILN